MIRLKHKSWEDITIPVYQEIIDIAQGGDGSEDGYANREIDILAVLCDSDRESLGNILIDDYAQLVKEARFMHKMPTYVPASTITLRGVEYNVVVDMSKFTLAQYTEYNALRADGNANISGILACLLVPTSAKSYADGYDVSDVVSAIESELPYYKAFGILNFFLLAQSISFATLLSKESRKMRKMARTATTEVARREMKKRADHLRRAYTSLGRCLLSR